MRVIPIETMFDGAGCEDASSGQVPRLDLPLVRRDFLKGSGVLMGTLATGSVLGLANRGWERGQAQDGGWVGWFTRRVADTLEVQVQLDPGTAVGEVAFEPKQKLPELTLRKRGTWDADGLVPFGDLHPIIASEVLRDIDLLAALED